MGKQIAMEEQSTPASDFKSCYEAEGNSIYDLSLSINPATENQATIAATTKATTTLSAAPDGGVLAWSQVLAGHLVSFNAWGYVNSFGIFQAYYTSTFHDSPSTISWVGGVQIFLMMAIGAFSGRALDAGYYYHVAVPGYLLQLLGVFSSSFASSYWQLFLSQGVCQGIGSGLVLTPTMALVTTYFVKHRAMAVCGMSSGTATGGVIFPLIARQLLPKIGRGWTVRVMGFVFLINASLSLAIIRPRSMNRKNGPLVELSSFLDPWYFLLSLGMLLVVLGIYFVFYYVNSYAQDILHTSYSTSLDVLLVMNAMGLPGRLIPAYIADRWLGPQTTLTVVVLLTSLVTFTWIAVDSLRGLWAFSIIFGFVAANIQSMVPPAIASSGRDPTKIGVEVGMIFAINGVGCLCGPSIAGALIERAGGSYLYAQAYTGAVILCAGIIFAICRTLRVGLALKWA